MMITSKPGFKFLFLIAFFFCNTSSSFSQKRTYNLVKDFGAKADDKTDNYTAFVKAAQRLSNTEGSTLIIPKGKYYIASYKILGGNKKNNITDIVFKNCKRLTIEGNNSVIRLNGNFYRNRDYQVPGLSHYYAFNNTVCVFKLTNCKDVLLKNFILNGEVDKMKKQVGVVEGESYGVNITDNEPGEVSSKIMLQNITAHHFAADGFLLQSNGEDIVMNKCRSYNNARQGLSIVKGSNIKCLNSIFDSTGFTGAYGWHAPGAGIDVENEFGPGRLSNVLIQNCILRGNKGFQIVTTLPSEKVVIDSCFISDLTAGYSDGLNGVGMYSLNSVLSNSILFATIQVDIADQIYTGPAIQEFRNNFVYSGHRGIVSASFSRPCNITENFFIMLPNSQLDTYFPYIQNGNCRFNRNIVVYHADRIKRNPNQISALLQYVEQGHDNFWLANGYTIPKDKRYKEYYVLALNGAREYNNQFFPRNQSTEAINLPAKRMLSDVQIDKILAPVFFTAFKQRSFSRKFLLQAMEVKKYAASVVASAK